MDDLVPQRRHHQAGRKEPHGLLGRCPVSQSFRKDLEGFGPKDGNSYDFPCEFGSFGGWPAIKPENCFIFHIKSPHIVV
jgi:hypothetical protein